MTVRSLLLLTAMLAATSAPAFAQVRDQVRDDVIASPVLRASVTVTGDVVRVGDVIDNAGSAAKIAIYRAPDLGTTGSLPVAQVLATLRAHQVIGVDTRDLREISVTRLARNLEGKDIELQVARALEHRSGLGDAANLSLTFDRDVQDLKLDASNSGAMQPISTRYESRSNRFDVTLEIANDNVATPTRLRFTGTAIETVEAAVLTRGVERKVLKVADLAKPDLVQRDQSVTLIYEAVGLYLTIRGKALEGGTEGDVVSVLNLQSKRTVSGVVVGRGQVSISVPTPRLPAAAETTSSLAPRETAAVAVAAVSTSQVAQQIAPKAE